MRVFHMIVVVLAMGTIGFPVRAQMPAGYYGNAYHKSGYALKTALSGIIVSHEQLDYADLWDAYGKTDTDSAGYVIDMYNGCQFLYKEEQCGSGSSGNAENQCVCYNREHAMPKSWFHEGKPMYTDLFHLYPVSGYINTRRSNYPYGEVEDPSFTSTFGSRLGPCSFPGYSGTVFEPVDAFKGDFARSYFYMVTCYESKVSEWDSPMLDGSTDQAFTDWAVELLLKWHEEDPVSEKERQRNEAVYLLQGNRNPFIDYPELVEKIWGDDDTPFQDEDDPARAEDRMREKCHIRMQGKYFQLDYDGFFDSVSVVDATGRVVVSSSVRQSGFGFTLPVSGLYIVQLREYGKVCSLKLLVP